MNIVLRLAWRNIWRQPRRTWLTTGAMIFSNALLVFMMSIQFGMYDLMINNTLQSFGGHLQVQAPGYKDDQKMRQSVPDIQALAAVYREDAEFKNVAARGAAFALASSEDRSYGIQVFGVEPLFEPGVSNIPGLIGEGRFLGGFDAPEIVIGKVLARNLRVRLGDELTLLGSGRDGSFAANIVTIVGIFDSGIPDMDRSIAEIPLGLFQDTFAMEQAGHQVVITTAALTDVPAAITQAEVRLPDDVGLVVHGWEVLHPGLKQAIQADLTSAWFMYGLLVVLVAFSVMNTQLMSVLERTKEFGIVMSLGLTPGRLGRLVMLETALMGLMGLALGAFLGALITTWFTFNGFSYPGMEEMSVMFNLPDRFYPEVGLDTLFIGPAVVFVGTLISALYPALRLHWLQPVEAMRAA
jgi:ABC-type lipoprotein release transport system permease subunit